MSAFSLEAPQKNCTPVDIDLVLHDTPKDAEGNVCYNKKGSGDAEVMSRSFARQLEAVAWRNHGLDLERNDVKVGFYYIASTVLPASRNWFVNDSNLSFIFQLIAYGTGADRNKELPPVSAVKGNLGETVANCYAVISLMNELGEKKNERK